MSSRLQTRLGRTLLAAAAFAISAGPARGTTPLGALRYTPDITVDLSGTTVDHNEVAQDDLAGLVILVDIGAIPSAAIVTAYDRLDSGDQLLSFDIDLDLGGLAVRPGDVVRYDGTSFALLFDAAANGIPRGVITDAVSAIGPMDLLLSFDIPVMVGTATAFDRDILRFHDGVFSLFFDGAAAGVANGTDLDALHCIQQNGHLLMSFDVSGVLGGVPFDDEDVLEYTPGPGTFELAYDGQSEHAGWFGADLQALFAITEPAPLIIPPMIGDPATDPPGINTVEPGSTRVSGRGTARAKPGDTCIQIWDAGPNGVPDDPPGSIDDVLLGTGGTDENGNFVAPDGTFGIPVMPPLHGGQRIFAVDVCADLASTVIETVITPAPVLSPALLGVFAILLGTLGAWAVHQRTHPTRSRGTGPTGQAASSRD
jgi:hypothetical protein